LVVSVDLSGRSSESTPEIKVDRVEGSGNKIVESDAAFQHKVVEEVRSPTDVNGTGGSGSSSGLEALILDGGDDDTEP